MIVYNIQTNGPVNQLVIEIINDSVYIEPSAIAYISGKISFDVDANKFSKLLKAKFIGKKFFKPKLHGTGKIYLHATLGHYHKFTLKNNEEMLLGRNSFLACRDSIEILPKIDISIKNFLSGTPMINMLAKGNGNIMVLMPGPVSEITLDENSFVVFSDDDRIAGYSTTLQVTHELSKISWGMKQKMIRIFRGTGSIYFTSTPNKDYKS